MGSGFSFPRPNVIASDAGFSVEVVGQTGLLFVENGRTMQIDSEALATPGTLVLYSASIRKWDPPHSSEPVAQSDRDRILANIQALFDYGGYKLQVI